jgi:hypothetical protein
MTLIPTVPFLRIMEGGSVLVITMYRIGRKLVHIFWRCIISCQEEKVEESKEEKDNAVRTHIINDADQHSTQSPFEPRVLRVTGNHTQYAWPTAVGDNSNVDTIKVEKRRGIHHKIA